MATNNYDLLPALNVLNQYLSTKAKNKVLGDYTKAITENVSTAKSTEDLNKNLQANIAQIYSDEYLDPQDKSVLTNILGQQATTQGRLIAESEQKLAAKTTMDALQQMGTGAQYYYGGKVVDAQTLRNQIASETSDPVLATKLYETALKNNTIQTEEDVIYNPYGVSQAIQMRRTASGIDIDQQMSPILKTTRGKELYRDTNRNNQFDTGEQLSQKQSMLFESQKAKYDIGLAEEQRRYDLSIQKSLAQQEISLARTNRKAYESALRGTRKDVYDPETNQKVTALVKLKPGTTLQDFVEGRADYKIEDILTKKDLTNIVRLEAPTKEERVYDLKQKNVSAAIPLKQWADEVRDKFPFRDDDGKIVHFIKERRGTDEIDTIAKLDIDDVDYYTKLQNAINPEFVKTLAYAVRESYNSLNNVLPEDKPVVDILKDVYGYTDEQLFKNQTQKENTQKSDSTKVSTSKDTNNQFRAIANTKPF